MLKYTIGIPVDQIKKFYKILMINAVKNAEKIRDDLPLNTFPICPCVRVQIPALEQFLAEMTACQSGGLLVTRFANRL